jgi:hypothetical protein
VDLSNEGAGTVEVVDEGDGCRVARRRAQLRTATTALSNTVVEYGST